MRFSSFVFAQHLRRCTRRHFVTSSSAAFAGVVLAGCGGAGTIPGISNALAGSRRFDSSSKSGSLTPVPIPGNPDLGGIHIQLPANGIGDEPATVYNFNGLVGRAVVSGTGTGNGQGLFWAVDAGFMRGEYVSTSGIHAHGTFVFT